MSVDHEHNGMKWSGPQKCSWEDCASKATFRSPSSLRTHIRNIHETPLVCTHPGCSYKKPFGKPCDLKRHIATIHSTECGYQCLEIGCPQVFSRKDKMISHAKEKHGLFRCSYNHCSATVFASQKESHLQESHCRNECAIGSCRSGQRSFFTEQNLKRHMRTCHRMSYDAVFTAMPYPFKREILYAHAPVRPSYQDCATCLSGSCNE